MGSQAHKSLRLAPAHGFRALPVAIDGLRGRLDLTGNELRDVRYFDADPQQIASNGLQRSFMQAPRHCRSQALQGKIAIETGPSEAFPSNGLRKVEGVGDVKGGGKNVKDRTGSGLFLYPMFLAPQSTEKYKQKKGGKDKSSAKAQ